MIKVIMLMKRRPGMTVSEFRDYYENKHRVIGEKYLNGFAIMSVTISLIKYCSKNPMY